jgi:large subunit ribosomal protein L21
MNAVIKTGGKQYRVAEGDVLEIEKIKGDVGQEILFNEVLLVSSENNVVAGTPYINGASVTAQILGQKKEDKIIVFKMKRRKNYRKKQGHRQMVTSVRVTKINYEQIK